MGQMKRQPLAGFKKYTNAGWYGIIGGLLFLYNSLRDKRVRSLDAAVVMITVIAVLGINHIAYTRRQDWRDYVEWKRISTQMRDFGRFSFENNKEKFLEAGVTEKNYLLLDNYIFADSEGLSVDKMKQIGFVYE